MAKDKRWSVYVVKLREDARERLLGSIPSLQRQRIDRRLPLLYVGVTALTPKRRYAKHKEGGQTAASIVRDFGVGLLESLYRERNPLPAATEKEALAAEAELAEELRDRGYAVWGEHGRPLQLDR